MLEQWEEYTEKSINIFILCFLLSPTKNLTAIFVVQKSDLVLHSFVQDN